MLTGVVVLLGFRNRVPIKPVLQSFHQTCFIFFRVVYVVTGPGCCGEKLYCRLVVECINRMAWCLPIVIYFLYFWEVFGESKGDKKMRDQAYYFSVRFYSRKELAGLTGTR